MEIFATNWAALCANAKAFHLDLGRFRLLEDFFARVEPDFFRRCCIAVRQDFPMAEVQAHFSSPELEKFLLLCIVANYPAMAEIYRQQKLPHPMLEEISWDLPRRLEILYRDLHGYGLTPDLFWWSRNCISAQVKSFGRLQANDISFFQPDLSLYRQEDGRLEEHPAFQRENPPHPDLTRGDKVISLHIPSTGPLLRTQCLESFRRIRDFSAEFHPDYDFKAVVCASWLLDPQLEGLLPPTSNILQFQKLGYIVPQPERDRSTDARWRIWGNLGNELPPEQLPVRTTLEKQLVAFFRSGGTLHGGLLVIFRDQLEDLVGNP